MGGTTTDHAENRREDATHTSDLLPIDIVGGGKCVVVPEQLVRAVDEVNFQRDAPGKTISPSAFN
jgi:hypothetical protein